VKSGSVGTDQWLDAPAGTWEIISAINQAGAWATSLAGLPDAETRAKAAGTNWVAYDMESIWASSDPDRRHPLRSITKFGKQAHADGFNVLMGCYWQPARYVKPPLPDVPFHKFMRAQSEQADILVVQTPWYNQCVTRYVEKMRAAAAVAQKADVGTVIANRIAEKVA